MLAQRIYGALYLCTLVLSCGIYRCAGNIPNWILLFLPLSKRLHSIFALRLFNDCWSVALVQVAILSFQNGFYNTGIMLFRLVISNQVKDVVDNPSITVPLFP
jgi:alpha-1,3-mannosyltransferase